MPLVIDMPEQMEIPLHLCQVLEEEYNNLHGELDPEESIDIDGVPVTVGSDWRFAKGHVNVPELLSAFERARRRMELAEEHRLEEERRNWLGPVGIRIKKWWKPVRNWWDKGEQPLPVTLREELSDDLAAHISHELPRLPAEASSACRGRTETQPAAGAAAPPPAIEPASPRPGGETHEQAVIRLLNEVLSEPKLFEKKFFERLPLGTETRELMRVGWPDKDILFRGDDLMRFRRLLLEEAFPQALKRVYQIRLTRVLGAMLARRQAALCFSGGGIRSATFSLGVLQGLAGCQTGVDDPALGRRRSLLERFDYLSTVSGGGFIGGWLTAWIHRHPLGLRGVVDSLAPKATDDKLEPEPGPLRHLRDYSNFLTPKKGVLTADTWAFISIYFRNLFLNWSVMIPLLLGCLMAPRLLVALAKADPGGWVQMPALVLGTFLGGFVIAYMRLNRPSNSGAVKPDGFWARRRDQSSFLRWCLVPLIGSTVLLTSYWSWTRPRAGGGGFKEVPADSPAFWRFVLFGLAVGLLMWLYVTARAVRKQWGVRPWWRVLKDKLPQLVKRGLLWGFLGGFLLFGGSYLWNALRAWVTDSGDRPRMGFVLFGAVLGLTGSLLYLFFVFRSWWRQKRLKAMLNALWEVVMTVLVCVVGALILFQIASGLFEKTVPDRDKFIESATVQPTPDKSTLKGAVGDVDLSVEATRPKPATADGAADTATEIFASFAGPLFLLTFLVGVTFFVGVTSREHMPHAAHVGLWKRGRAGFAEGLVLRVQKLLGQLTLLDEDREWLARFSAWVLIVVICWIVFTALVIFGPLVFYQNWKIITPVGTLTSVATVLAAHSSRTPARSKMLQSVWQAVILPNLLAFGSLAFVVFLVVVLSFATGALIQWAPFAGPVAALWPQLIPPDAYREFVPYPLWGEAGYQTLMRATHFPPLGYLLALTFVFFLVGSVLSRFIDLNKFSLHGSYRNRLMRAYLGASRSSGERRPNPFTGFDPLDNIHMHELRPGLLYESDFKDLEAFVTKLQLAAQAGRAGVDPIDVFLRREITGSDAKTQWLLNTHRPGVEPSQTLKSALLEDLNRLLEVADFDAEAAFRGVTRTPDMERVKRVLRYAPGRSNIRIVLNRLLLEAHYCDELERMPFPPPPFRLLHVVNMALNLVAGERLAWQQRKAESFTSTMLHSGSFRVGYRPSRNYGGKDGISLATAAAVSGAAVNSNMGYYSVSAAVTFALTFVNARLGWWLGNPGPAGMDTYYLSSPRRAVSPIIDEAFGLTNDTNAYVLLSDGGHFENLGLYEMILRRCHTIVLVDGSADARGEYDDLGNAVRKVRIDFGIDIEFKSPPFLIFSRDEKDKGKVGGYCALGRIHYEHVDGRTLGAPEGDDPRTGHLVYIKPAFYGREEPRDIYNYAQGNEKFPHDPTFPDQFFDESQFESYRMLGAFIMSQLCGGAPRRADDDKPGDAVKPAPAAKPAGRGRRAPDAPGGAPVEAGIETGLATEDTAALDRRAAAGAVQPSLTPRTPPGEAQDKFADFVESVKDYVTGIGKM